jgi:hypothetical protein
LPDGGAGSFFAGAWANESLTCPAGIHTKAIDTIKQTSSFFISTPLFDD